MKQNKQKALERLREIEKEKIKNLLDFKEKLINDNNFNELNCFNGLSMSLIKEAQKIKDDWEDYCGKEFILGKEVNSKGEFKRDIKEICGNCDEDYEIMFLCSTCKAQNKEKEEICGRILG